MPGSPSPSGAPPASGAPAPQPAAPAAAARPKRRRLRKVLKWTAISLGGLLILVVLLVWLVLANLNSDFVKSRIVGIVADSTGLSLDYEGLEVSLSDGVTADRLVIASPDKFAAHAPNFVVIEGLSIEASLWGLPFGGDIEASSVSIDRISVATVSDEHGATTLSELFPPSDDDDDDDDDEPAKPLSHSLRDLPAIAVGEVSIKAIDYQHTELAGGAVARRSTAKSLTVFGPVSAGSRGLAGTRLTVAGADDKRLSATVEQRADSGELETRRGSLSLEIVASAAEPDAIALTTSVDGLEQDVSDALAPIASLLSIDASVVFDPDAGKTTARLVHLRAVDKTLDFAATATLPDDEAAAIEVTGGGAVRMAALPVRIEGVEVEQANFDISIDELSIATDAITGGGSIRGTLARANGSVEGDKALVSDLSVDVTASLDGTMTSKLSGDVTVGQLRAESAEAAAAVDANELVVALRGSGVVLDGDATAAPASANSVSVRLAEVDAVSGRERYRAEKLDLVATGVGWLESAMRKLPIAADVKLSLAEGSQSGAGASMKARGTEVTARATGVRAVDTAPFGVVGNISATAKVASFDNRAGPQRISARSLSATVQAPLTMESATGNVRLGSARIAEKGAAPIDVRGVRLALSADRPMELAPFAPGSGGATVRGSVGAVGFGPAANTKIPRLDIKVSKRSASSYRVVATTRSRAVTFGGKALGDDVTTKIVADASLSAPKVALKVNVTGPSGPDIDADVSAHFRRGARRLTYDIDAKLSKLDAIGPPLRAAAPAVAALDLGRADITIKGHGDLRGVLVPRGRFPALAADPLESVRGKQNLDVRVRGIHYDQDGTEIDVPGLAIAASSDHGDGGAGKATVRITGDEVRYKSGADRYAARKLDETLTATFDAAVTEGTLRIENKLTMASGAQNAVKGYELGDVSLHARIDVEKMRAAVIRRFVFDNKRGGTNIVLAGTLERAGVPAPGPSNNGASIPGRNAVTLSGTVRQDVAAAAKTGFVEKASGKVVVPFKVESGDLTTFRLESAVRAENVSVRTTDGSLRLSGLSGVIPIVEEVALLPSGMMLIPGPRTNALSRTRFFDVHPFLDSEDYITAKSIRYGGQKFGPIAGNVRIERSTFSVDQLQLGYRSGKITGQVRADYRDRDPRVALRLNITGVRPTGSKDVLDANAAVTFRPRTLDLAGKIQIVRIGRDHLLELLDIIDPYRATVNVNKVRLALKVGYPKFVRIKLHDGTLDAKVELGGVASAVRIDEIKAVPLGPILETYVAPYLPDTRPTGGRAAADAEDSAGKLEETPELVEEQP